MRNHMNDEEREASRILDWARGGGEVPDSTLIWCLWVLGDLESLRGFE